MSYWSRFSSVFSYPFREEGWVKFGVMLAVLVCVSVAQIMPIVGWLALLFCGLYFLAAFVEMIRHASEGLESVPHWPVLANFRDEVMTPLIRLFVTAFAAFWPAVCCFYRLHEETWGMWLWFAGIVYFPMALLRVIEWEGFRGLNPWKVLLSAVRAPLAYLFCVVMFALVVHVPFFAGYWLNEMGASLAWVLVLPLSLLIYLTMVFCFALGRMCLFYSVELGIQEEGEV